MKDIVERLRERLIVVPKPGTVPRDAMPNEWITCTIGGEYKDGDDAGLQYVQGSVMLPQPANFVARLQLHIYAIEPLCREAANEIERLRTWRAGTPTPADGDSDASPRTP